MDTIKQLGTGTPSLKLWTIYSFSWPRYNRSRCLFEGFCGLQTNPGNPRSDGCTLLLFPSQTG